MGCFAYLHAGLIYFPVIYLADSDETIAAIVDHICLNLVK